MVKSVVAERLKGIAQKDLDAAQNELNELCKKFDLRPWKITSGHADWRELCLRIIGISEKTLDGNESTRVGRPTRDMKKVRMLGNSVDALRSFSRFDDNMKPIGGPWKLEEAIQMVVEYYGLKEERYHSGEIKDPKL